MISPTSRPGRHIEQLIVTGASPDQHPELHAILDKYDDWRVAWIPTLRDLRSAARSPNLILVVVRPGESLHAVSEATRQICATTRPSPIVYVFPAGTSEEDLARLGPDAEFVVTPLCPSEVRARIRRRLDGERTRRVAQTCIHVTEQVGLDAVLGNDVAFASVKVRLPAIASADATVLISGDTGTGKEVIARTIHYLSRRTDGPFLPVDCGAIPIDLFENELFGHKRGAFTDARTSEAGLIAEADGGTLFLDEVDSIPILAQAKLLRFLQDHTYRPLGHASFQRANVRVVAATNADLEAKVNDGTFRRDLYYRLNIIQVTLPPLRERRSDVPLLATHFLDTYVPGIARAAWQFDPAFFEALAVYEWPGNIRELENLIQQIVATTSPGTIRPDVLPWKLRADSGRKSPTSFRVAKALAVAAFEHQYTSGLLSAHGGNITKAALAAGTDRRVFGRLVKKHSVRASGVRAGQVGRTAG